MARPTVLSVLILAGALAAAGCGGSGGGNEDLGGGPGRAAYSFHCSACHGRNGLGSKHLFPPLAGESWVNDDPAVAIRVVLKGLEGKLVVEGTEYMNSMPPLGARLGDAEIAEILTFVRGSFGNRAGPVTAAEVAAERAAVADRERPWKVEEMESFRAALRDTAGRSIHGEPGPSGGMR
jgi:mono/diheme cytochrome c family protein